MPSMFYPTCLRSLVLFDVLFSPRPIECHERTTPEHNDCRTNTHIYQGAYKSKQQVLVLSLFAPPTAKSPPTISKANNIHLDPFVIKCVRRQPSSIVLAYKVCVFRFSSCKFCHSHGQVCRQLRATY